VELLGLGGNRFAGRLPGRLTYCRERANQMK